MLQKRFKGSVRCAEASRCVVGLTQGQQVVWACLLCFI